jgi:hypothetical protein
VEASIRIGAVSPLIAEAARQLRTDEKGGEVGLRRRVQRREIEFQ